MAYTDYLDTIQKVYIGYYQRPADPGGLLYWAERLDGSGGNLNQIIEAFANCPESQALYGTIDSSNISDVVDDIYNALFNRDAEAGGLAPTRLLGLARPQLMGDPLHVSPIFIILEKFLVSC